MARRISRPAALRLTQIAVAWGLSANQATLLAWVCGVAAAAAFGWGTVAGWLLGAGLLQLWYLLDHVDGQLARLRGTASLDGAGLDYLMHHTINLLVPLGVGYGLFARRGEPLWLLVGLVWGVSLLLATLQHDVRYKAFVRRLKRLRGTLEVHGGGGGRPTAQPPVPRSPLRLTAWTARKACEIHVIMNALALLALGQFVLADTSLLAGRIYLVAMAPIAAAVTAFSIARSQWSQSAEHEFAAWYRVPDDCELTFSDGWWLVEPREEADRPEDRESAADAQGQGEPSEQSS